RDRGTASARPPRAEPLLPRRADPQGDQPRDRGFRVPRFSDPHRGGHEAARPAAHAATDAGGCLRFPMRRTLLGLVALAATLVSARTAFAAPTPVQLVLLYMPDVSNSGTPAASGIAELVMQEGEVRVSATGLPHLDDPDRYVAWLVNSQTNQSLRV